MSDKVVTTITRDSKGKKTGTTTTTTSGDDTQPGKAWVYKNGQWVKPSAPKGVSSANLAWDDDRGWITKEQQASEWDYPLAVINSDPSGSLKKVFDEAWKAEQSGAAWDQAKFSNAIKSTAWYTKRGSAQRQYDALAADPSQQKELQRRIDAQLGTIRTLAQKQGVQFDDIQLTKIAKDSLRFGYTNDEINGIFAKQATGSGRSLQDFFENISGETGVGADKNTILDWAKNNGVSVSDSWVAGQAQEILAGNHDVQKSKDYITNLAKLAYPAHADYLDSKTSVMDRAQTYAQKISKMLEVPFEQIDLSNQHLKNALNPGEDGKAKNFTQIEQELRGTADWAKTNNAKETVNGMVNNILNKFGLA